jgi:hypothetical protein
MAIFYTDSGSFETLEVTGSTILSGSLIVSGATNFGPSGLTGSLFGTASNATSASFATTSSFTTIAITSSYVSSDLGAGNPTVVNTNAGGGLVLQGTGVGQVAQLRIVPNAGGWVDNINTAYFQVLATTGNYLTVMGGTFAADTVLERLQFNSKFTQLSNGFYNTTPAPSYVFQVLNLTSSATPVVSILGNSSQTANYLDVTTDGGTAGGIFTIKGTGNVGVGVPDPASKLQIQGNVSASSYTSSLNNQVGYLGTSSWAVSASWAPSGTPGGNAFPYNGTVTPAVISGSLIISGSGATPALRVTGSTQFIGSGSTVFAVSGSLGPLFEVVDSISGELFTISSASIDIFKIDNSKNILISGSLNVNGPSVMSGSLLVSRSVANPVTITGSINDFFELEIVNANAGNAASADIVASNDLTTDVGNYIDMGINSSTYAGALVGGPSDGYLYFTSSVGELHVGNASTGATSNVRLFAGGPSSDNTTRVFISSSGNVGIGTTTNLLNKLTVQGSVSASSVTSSFTGSFTGALTHFNPVTLKLTVGTTAPSSPAVNDLWVDTN